MKFFLKIIKCSILIIILIFLILTSIGIIGKFSRLTNRYGVIDKNGNTVLDFKYLVIAIPDNGDLKADSYEVMIGDFFGRYKNQQIIDLEGNVCFDEEKDGEYFPSFYYNRGMAHSRITNKEGYIDVHKNKLHPFIYDEVDDYDDGYAMVYKYDENGEYEHCGLIDLDENIVLDFKYDYIKVLSEYFFKVYVGDEKYIVNRNGENISEPIVDKTVTFVNYRDLSKLGELSTKDVSFYDKFIIVKDETSESYFDINGVLIHKYENCSVRAPIDTNYFVIIDDNHKNGYVADILNNCENVYESDDYEIWNVIGGKVIVKDVKTEKFGLVDLNGNVIIPVEYDALGALESDKTHVLPTKGNKKGLMDLDGKTLIEPTSEYKMTLLGDGETYITSKRIPTLFAAYASFIGLAAVYTLFMLIKFIKFIKDNKKLENEEKQEEKVEEEHTEVDKKEEVEEQKEEQKTE